MKYIQSPPPVLYTSGGMSLRDYFAGLAMQGLVAQSMGSASSSPADIGAEYAYAMADAMLAEREKEGGGV